MVKIKYTILNTKSIRDALIKIDENKLGIVFVINKAECVVGSLTDGDIRACLLGTATLSDSIEAAYNRDFIWRRTTDSRETILKLLDSKIKVIPILGRGNRLVDIVTPNDFPAVYEKNIYARSKAPVRVSFAGGGSDLTPYFFSDVGAVINATIGLFCHATLRPREDLKVNINSLDLAKTIECDTLEDFFSMSDDFNLFRSVLQLIRPSFGFDLYVNSDFPSGSGLGGSSAVMAAILGCFNELRSDKWTDYELADLAFHAERLNMGISGGWQDQYATVFGGFNFIEFKKENNLIHPLRLTDKIILNLQESLLLFGISSGRNSGLIHDDQETSMAALKVKKKVNQNVKHCYNMRENLLRGNLNEFGSGLNIAWQLKKQFSSKISNKELDKIYDYAMENGALGGKLLGAGGGGFFLFYCEDFAKNRLLAAMKKKGLTHTAFQFEQNGMQSWINRDESKNKNANSES